MKSRNRDPQNRNAPEPSRLARRLNTADAVAVGLGAMIGTGVFAAIGPASAAAGAGLLPGLVLAAFAAYCNAVSSAQLAAVYPESGGTYIYGRKRLSNFWGWLAGWAFIAGKLASCAAAALTFGNYLYPPAAKPLALAALAALTAANYRGVKKTAGLVRVLLAAVLLSLAAIVFASLFGGTARAENLLPLYGPNGLRGIFQAGAIMFFAFAGYARIATLGEEVIEPRRTIPKAIEISLAVVLIVYAVTAASALAAAGPEALAGSKAPLARAVEAGRFAWLSPAAKIGAAAATLGVLLSLMAGISRTAFSMASNGDLPRWLSAVHRRFKVPHRADIAAAGMIAVIVLSGDIRSAIGFSAFTILIYYAITNAAAFTLPNAQRLRPRWLAAAGFLLCGVLAFSLPLNSLISGGIIVVLGAVIFKIKGSHLF